MASPLHDTEVSAYFEHGYRKGFLSGCVCGWHEVQVRRTDAKAAAVTHLDNHAVPPGRQCRSRTAHRVPRGQECDLCRHQEVLIIESEVL